MSQTESDPTVIQLIKSDPNVELSANRTSLSFERTRMSADRTLMSIVRTSLSLITFGFTIYQTFNQLAMKGLLPDAHRTARSLGISLLVLGIVLLIMGILSHLHFGRELTMRRERLYSAHLLQRAIQYRATPTFVVASVLLFIGVAALASIAWRIFG
jgi:putative membrane protein